MWTDYYLKAADEATLVAALPEEWMERRYGEQHAFEMVGKLEGSEGYFHANLRLKGEPPLPEALAALVIDAPEHPKCVFLGAGDA